MTSNLDRNAAMEVKGSIPKKRQDLLRWDGWGYKDSHFVYDGDCYFTGSRYPIGGGKLKLNKFRDWVIDRFDIDVNKTMTPAVLPTTFPETKKCPAFLEEIKRFQIEHSDDGVDRLVRCHGQTLHDIDAVRQATYKRIPDLILWPKCHEDCVKIVEAATRHNIAVIPYGGGTSVSGAATTPEHEDRLIAIIDTTQMNRMLWFDKDNLTACFESGIVGQDLERTLKNMGYTMGHEPDSCEFSTLGGWVATRASGMKKNVYGNIEDIVVRVKMLTCKGTLEKNASAPRISCGPDLNHLIFGSEGTLGIVTEVVVKVRPVPEVKVYGSLVFPTLEVGVACLREIAKKRLQPASIRLIDNEQFIIGLTMRPDGGTWQDFTDWLKKTYLTKIAGFDYTKLAVATLVFEGDADVVKNHEKKINEIAKRHGAIVAGANNGEKGYLLTFVIAYVRDFGWNYNIVAESFETSVPWNQCLPLIYNVKSCIAKECKRRKIDHFIVSARVTQSYDAGCCVYFYYGFKKLGLDNPIHTFEEIEEIARNVILETGGSVSHHHGIGKNRARWYQETVSDVGVQIYKAAKQELDPKNIFAAGNLLPELNQKKTVQQNVTAKL